MATGTLALPRRTLGSLDSSRREDATLPFRRHAGLVAALPLSLSARPKGK